MAEFTVTPSDVSVQTANGKMNFSRGKKMSYSWPPQHSVPLTSIKPAISFADALKRLAEHVEEKNRLKNNVDTSSPSHLSIENSNVPTSSNENHALSSEQALRVYTQCFQEMERRSYLRSFGNAEISNPPHRRFDVPESYPRFMMPPLSALVPPTGGPMPLFPSPTRLPFPPSFIFPSHIKNNDSTSNVPKDNAEDKKSDRTSQTSKSPLKLFRPYELDSPETKMRQTLSSSMSKKAISSPSTPSNNTSSLFEENRSPSSSSTSSLGREKQLFNSLGLVQPTTDIISEKNSILLDQSQSSPSSSSNEETSPKSDVESEKTSSGEEKNLSESTHMKRKSIFTYPNPNKSASHRKQFKVKRIPTSIG